MNSEARVCRNCKQNFLIEAKDFLFYEKIKVPAPTWCPQCRMQRRMLWRNELILHRRKSSLSGEDIISQYPAETPFPVYSVVEFYARNWETPFADYDPNRSFFGQFHALQQKTPRRALLTDLTSIENKSIYQNAASRNKNCYLVFAAGDNEDCMYGHDIDRCKNVIDCLWTRRSQYSYECVDAYESSRLFFCEEVQECIDSWFLYNCRNCLNCFGCVGLRNKSYCLWNKQLSKEKYKAKVKLILQALTPAKITDFRSKLEELKIAFPHKFAQVDLTSSPTCTGNYILNSQDVKYGFCVHQSQNVRYVAKLINGKECWDVSDWGDPAELCYESITIGEGAYQIFFSSDCWPNCRELQYCDSCSDSHHLFGCVGMKNASYCILNKQYTKEEYQQLVPNIIEDMKQRGEYGEFFPPELSPFAYNETMAQDHFPLIKEDALSKGYSWANSESRNYQATKQIDELPEHILDIDDSVLEEIISCSHHGTCTEECSTAFRILPEELRFYRQFSIPLPQLCFNCRNTARMRQRNPLRLWHRNCQCAGTQSENRNYINNTNHFHDTARCPNEFETSYAPERYEVIYCEVCYQSEMAA